MDDHVTFGSTRRFFDAAGVRREPKTWGEELWIVNREYCGKKLHLKRDHRSSLHRHERKDEVLYLEHGKVLFEVGDETYTLAPGDFVHVPRATLHRFTGIEDSVLIEFSTFHQDEDSHRSEPSGRSDATALARLRSVVGAFAGVRVLVVGDVMLDTYLAGTIEDRAGGDAPVLRYHSVSRMPGGAANVAANVVSLGGRATLLGVRGDDEAGEQLLASLAGSGVDARIAVDAARPTTQKTRIATLDGYRLVRLDEERRDPLGPRLEAELLRDVLALVGSCDVVVLSDYAKGVLSASLMKECVAAARDAGRPVVLDPKPRSGDRSYAAAARGVTVMVPNRAEAETLAGSEELDDGSLARTLSEMVESSVLLTLGARGMVLVDGPVTRVVDVSARHVVDVDGAGDTVAAVVSLALGSAAPLADGADVASAAAALAVGGAGTTAVTADELLAAL